MFKKDLDYINATFTLEPTVDMDGIKNFDQIVNQETAAERKKKGRVEYTNPDFLDEKAKFEQALKTRKLGDNWKVFSQQELRNIFDSIDKLDDTDYTKARLRAQLALGYSAGLRGNEIVNIKLADIDLDNNQIKYKQAKTRNKTVIRTIQIPPSVAADIKDYVSHRGIVGSTYLFAPRPSNRKIADKPISTDVLRRDMKKLSELTKIPVERLRPHMLRHSFATHYLMLGMSIEEVQRLLGHAKLDTTLIYVHELEKYKRSHLKLGLFEGVRGLPLPNLTIPGPGEGRGVTAGFSRLMDGIPSRDKSRIIVALTNFSSDTSKNLNWLGAEIRSLPITGAVLSGAGIKDLDTAHDILQQEGIRIRQEYLKATTGGFMGVDDDMPSKVKAVDPIASDDSIFKDGPSKDPKLEASTKSGRTPTTGTLVKISELVDKTFKPVANIVNENGAKLVLQVAMENNMSIAQAYERIIQGIETTDLKLLAIGDIESRQKFHNMIRELFPDGIGRAGEIPLITPKDPHLKNVRMTALGPELIAQYLFDNKLLDDIDPANSLGTRANALGAARQSNLMRKDGKISRGTHAGRSINLLFDNHGHMQILGVYVDNTGIRRYVVNDDPNSRRYPYLTIDFPHETDPNRRVVITGYGLSETVKNTKLLPPPSWSVTAPTPRQRKFIEDMREYKKLVVSYQGTIDNKKQIASITTRMTEIETEWGIDRQTGQPDPAKRTKLPVINTPRGSNRATTIEGILKSIGVDSNSAERISANSQQQLENARQIEKSRGPTTQDPKSGLREQDAEKARKKWGWLYKTLGAIPIAGIAMDTKYARAIELQLESEIAAAEKAGTTVPFSKRLWRAGQMVQEYVWPFIITSHMVETHDTLAKQANKILNEDPYAIQDPKLMSSFGAVSPRDKEILHRMNDTVRAASLSNLYEKYGNEPYVTPFQKGVKSAKEALSSRTPSFMEQGTPLKYPAGKKTTAGRDVYIKGLDDPNEDFGPRLVSEMSRTFEQDGKWINVPSIHRGQEFTQEQLGGMLNREEISPTSTHGSLEEAEQAARKRSDEMSFINQ
tara:strand:+ start:69 stop:3245 length:3177 start_codon:yes stop_codon:yes gene_type:complete